MRIQGTVTNDGWKRSNANTFWSDIAPTEHVIQIYDNELVFLDALTGYVGGGINAGDCCVVIAKESNLFSLENQLKGHGLRIDTLLEDDRYMPFGVEDVLEKFMVDGMPDERLFIRTISEIFGKAKLKGRKVRAFGEMVVVLFDKGYKSATIELERLWNKYLESENFSLFCAYPQRSFLNDPGDSIHHVCKAHSKMIGGSQRQLTEIYYRDSKIA